MHMAKENKQSYHQILNNIKKQIIYHKDLNYEKFRSLKNKYDCVIIFVIILGPLVGLLSTIELILYSEEHKLIPIISTILSFISGITLSIVKQLNLEKKYNNYKLNFRKCQELNNKICQFIDSKEKLTQKDFKNYIQMLYNEVNDIFAIDNQHNVSINIDNTLFEYQHNRMLFELKRMKSTEKSIS